MIAATFHGSIYSPPNYDFDTIEVFTSLEDVIDALFDRYASNGRRLINSTFLDGSGQSVYWPTVGQGDSFTCYLMPEPAEDDEETAEDALEGARLAVHTAVHGGWSDYTVTLDESAEGTLRVIVEKAGL